ncbi:MAG: transposase [Planctomycetes bacterium]|nr:transposase [Planctomycetota bacterium]
MVKRSAAMYDEASCSLSLPNPRRHKQIARYEKSVVRYDIPGDVHALTFSCFGRQEFLAKDRLRSWLTDAIDTARRELAFDVWAYVLMPEHVHLLIYPRKATYSISNILLAIKRPVARHALSYVRRNAPSFLRRMRDAQPNGRVAHRFWQRGGGYDRNLIDAKTIRKTIDYIHLNPIRRDLAENPEDWYWSSGGL